MQANVASTSDVEDPEDVAANAAARKLVSNYTIKRTNSFADLPFADLLVIAAVNNSAGYDATDPSMVIGDASETALLRFCDSFGITEYYRNSYRIIHAVPFSSSTKVCVKGHECGHCCVRLLACICVVGERGKVCLHLPAARDEYYNHLHVPSSPSPRTCS
jgi:hypothetical protein